MLERWTHWTSTGDAPSVCCRWWLPLAAATVLWFDPSSGVSTALLWVAGLYALWNGRKTLGAWKNPVGLAWGLGVLWAILSAAWSFHPAGSARDLIKSAPLALAALAVPVVFDRPGRIWTALVASAGLVTAALAADLYRLVDALGWPAVLAEARFLHPYLYTHPNVSSMMAGLCALVFAARLLAGVRGRGRQAGLVLGLALDLAYLVVLASRGPQAVFAAAVLAFRVAVLPGWRARLVAALLAVAVGFGLWSAAGLINPRFKDSTMANFNDRDVIWKHAKMLADQRPVLGYGFGKKAFVKVVYENPEHRAPRVRVHFPHAHQYWLMLYFQGGAVGFALWSLGWLALGLGLGRFAARECRAASGWTERLRARVLPVLLGTGIAYILLYGIGDYPDHVIRHSQFYLAGLAVALIRPPAREGAA
ncbi:MAG TPA: hypothetical protein DCM68_01455 [Verrucomicrobia bacterium]|nr:hypothetical protein [Verrucomicrobiota bacterium]